MNTSQYLDPKEYQKFLVEQQNEKVKQQVAPAFEKPLNSPAALNLAKEIFKTKQNEIQQALQKDGSGFNENNPGPAFKAVLATIEKQIKEELAKASKAQPTSKQQLNNSLEQDYSELEVVDEDIFNRAASRLRAGKEAIFGGKVGQQPRNPRETAFLDRFNTFKKQMGSHLKELQLDLGKASDVDKTIKDNVSTMVSTINQQFGITPSASKFQELRHKVTSGALKVGLGGVALGTAAALVGPTVGALGLGAAAKGAVTYGLAGGISSMVKDLAYGQKPSAKKALTAATIGAAAGGIGGHLLGGQAAAPQQDMSGMADLSQTKSGFQVPNKILPGYQSHGAELDALAQTKTSSIDSAAQAPVADYAQSAKELGHQMSGASGLVPGVAGDDVLNSSMEVLRQQGIIGSNKAGQSIPSPAIYNYIAKVAKVDPDHAQRIVDYIKDMPKEEALDKFSKAARKSGEAVKLLRAVK